MAFTAGQKVRAADLNDALAAAGCEAQFNMAVDQSAAHATVVPVLFGTTVVSSTLVTKGTSGSGSTFTLNRAGVWTASATIRYQSGGSSAFSSVYCTLNGTQIVSQAVTTSSILVLHVALTFRANLNDVLTINVYHERGSSVTIKADNTNALGRLNLAWLHP
ncbi:hypothetical protein ACL02T_20385 [Pseudonocardia sp. RS010]|uniref:hypothetical protein n=1 Tax=Pseudonocardia sp. RS010 TaxID=3385979 RepID=UPI0039A0C2E8